MIFSPSTRFQPVRTRQIARRIVGLPGVILRRLGTNPSLRAFMLAVTLVMIWATLNDL